MHNELFSIGPFTVYGYGLMIAIGIFSAYCLAEYRARKIGLDDERVFGLTIWAVIGGIAGGKILYYLTILPQIAADPSLLYRDLMEGFVIYGALIGGFIGIVLYCRHWKMNVLSYLDLALPSVALAQGFGRLGSLVEERPVIGGKPGDEQGVEGQAQSQKGPQGRQAEEFPPLIDRQIHGCPSR